MSTALIQITGKGLYSPIENKHKEIRWSENFMTNSFEVYGSINNFKMFAISSFENEYVVGHFFNGQYEPYNFSKPYAKLSTAKAVCTNILRKEILKAVILLDNLANIKNIE